MKGNKALMSQAGAVVDGESGNDNWRTPANILDGARLVFDGPIALDPCADSDLGHHYAVVNYTVEMDAFKQDWIAPNAFMNPPYSQALTFNKRLATAFAVGDIDNAIILMAARTDTKKWRAAVEHASLICLVDGRLRFGDPRPGKEDVLAPATFPTALILLTSEGAPMLYRFAEAYEQLGQLWQPYDAEAYFDSVTQP